MQLVDLLPRRIREARQTLPGTPATTQPAQGVLPARSGYVQGVPPQGFGETEAMSSTASATNTDRRTFLQELWEEYLKCPWSWASVNAIARTVTAGGPVLKWDADTGVYGQKQPKKPAPVLALERLFAFCNDTQDIRQLCRNVVADLQVFGDAYVEIVEFAGIPVALYNQDCPTTFPETDKHGTLKGYKQVTEDGQTADFKPDQIIHISLDSARPSIFGVSPTHAAEESIVAWMYLHACEKEAARRGLPPNIHADLPAGMGDPEVRRWQDQHADRNLGPANVGTPITTKGGGKVTELQTAKLTDILQAKKEARDEIIGAYGVPPAKLGIIESGNLGGGTGNDQNKTFMLDIVRPIANLIAEKLQFALAVKAFGVKGWHVEFPTTDYRDDKTIADIQDQQVRLGARTLNDLRRELGRPPVDGGDDAVLVARQDIVLWSDMAARSAAAVAALGGGVTPLNDISKPPSPARPGPPPAVGTGPSKGPGGAPEETAAIAEAVIQRLIDAGVVAEHTAKLTARQRVHNQLAKNFPASAIEWVNDEDIHWDGPRPVLPSDIDTADKHEWNAVRDTAKVARIKKRYRRTGKMKPIVVVRPPGADKDIIADGHHHYLAATELGVTVRAYIGHVPSRKGPWNTLSLRQNRTAKESVAERRRISKQTAGYREPATSPECCLNCVMFQDDRCQLVQGDISPDGVCDRWQPDQATAAVAV